MASSERKRREGSAGDPKRSSGERSETERSEGAPAEGTSAPSPGDPEVVEKASRRQYPAEYKLRILQEADACKEPGEIGALLRREGLYSSLLSTWRRQREQGTLNGLSPKKRGRKAKERNPLAQRVAELERENRKLKKGLEEAQIIIEFQKKVSDILGVPLKSPQDEESD